MKNYSLITFLFFIPILLFSQKSTDKTVYFDSIWKETTKENYEYYRIIKDYYTEKDSYKIYDYYKSGVLQMKGTSKTNDGNSKEGEYTFYYANGNKKSLQNYYKSRVKGKFMEWYENGNPKLEGEYIDSEKGFNSDFKTYQYWNSKNEHLVIDGNGNYEEIDENLTVTGKVKNGFKDGVWSGKDKKTNYQYTDIYKRGEFISGKNIDSSGVEHTYDVLELRAMPKKGIQDFYNYVGQNFTKTKAAFENKISGKLFVTFIIDKDGKIVEPKVVKSLGYGLDEEAIRVITSYENWIPGQQRGVNVRVLYSIPITVHL
ncbi:energy transducer TonB [Flavobacterium sp. ov086]|uniref:energy transducer TonB n=1 Tax=Flavobacterium sp. ov086 TaxID=1761785 RepID=UPI000B75EE18|nr:energy transducer TonB [Flavobacterium sp. ov086]SNR94283.1 TonB family C-terminal domain-containing protein [Flavobacterium sp. ov086]